MSVVFVAANDFNNPDKNLSHQKYWLVSFLQIPCYLSKRSQRSEVRGHEYSPHSGDEVLGEAMKGD